MFINYHRSYSRLDTRNYFTYLWSYLLIWQVSFGLFDLSNAFPSCRCNFSSYFLLYWRHLVLWIKRCSRYYWCGSICFSLDSFFRLQQKNPGYQIFCTHHAKQEKQVVQVDVNCITFVRFSEVHSVL